MKTNITLLALAMIVTGCGGAVPEAEHATDEQPTADATPTPSPDSPAAPQNTTPGTDPVVNRAYTNTYGSTHCNSTVSDFECWDGTMDFHTSQHVSAFVIANGVTCYTFIGTQITNDPTYAQKIGMVNGGQAGISDLTCYSDTLGPVAMNAKVLSGMQNSDTYGILSTYVNANGQVCFRSAEWRNGSIVAIFTPCGNTLTNSGGIQ